MGIRRTIQVLFSTVSLLLWTAVLLVVLACQQNLRSYSLAAIRAVTQYGADVRQATQTLDLPGSAQPRFPEMSEQQGGALAEGKIDAIWHDADVRESDEHGMRIHARFSISNAAGGRFQAIVYFFWASSGQKLQLATETGHGQFLTADGQPCVARCIAPVISDFSCDDLAIFMPYDRLLLRNPGRYELAYTVELYDLRSNRHIASSELSSFSLSAKRN